MERFTEAYGPHLVLRWVIKLLSSSKLISFLGIEKSTTIHDKNLSPIILSNGLWCSACGTPSEKSSLIATSEPYKAEVSSTVDTSVYRSENLLIWQLSEHVYEHISYLDTESFGKVSCNGMVVVKDGEAIVFDTPTDEKSSRELIHYFTEKSPATIKAVVAIHFHTDCVGGLRAFHRKDIPSYASRRTINLLKNKKDVPELPHNGFDDYLELEVGNKKVLAEFFGEGHTKDNVIGYFPEEKVIFGGCLFKEEGAGKGNLEDANVQAWILYLVVG